VRPADLFGRDDDWDELVRSSSGRAHLTVLTGRRRTGKTYLARRLAAQAGGLLVSCADEERQPALQHFADDLGRHHGVTLGAPPDWAAAIDQATQGPLAVPLLVIDELPYLLGHSPEIESVLQHAVDRARDTDGSRIVLCGSSMSVMGSLLDGGRPLNRRADVELMLQPFDYRTAARFWDIDDPHLAFRMHAILGGSPGYRALADDRPDHFDDLAPWIITSVMNPSRALYHEDTYLLSEDTRLVDKAIYGTILRTIASGEHKPSRIGGRIGRPQTSLSHSLGVLVRAGFVVNDSGILSEQDPQYRITDEIIRFLRACVEPWRPVIEDGRRAEAWASAEKTWWSQILGPHVERLARVWVGRFASPDLLGGVPGIIGRAEVADRSARTSREIDVVALQQGQRPGPEAKVLCIGEAKLTADVDAVHHLDEVAALLARLGHGRPEKLLVFAEDATDELRAEVRRRRDLELVDLDRLYEMS
jgi:uncharacterized protein